MADTTSRSRWTPLALALTAILILALVGGFALRASRQTRDTTTTNVNAMGTAGTDTTQPAPATRLNRPDPDGQAAKAAYDEIFGRIRSLEEVRDADVAVIEGFVATTDTTEGLISARNALAVAADRLAKASMEPSVRTRLEGVVITALASAQWRMRLSGLSAVSDARLTDRPGVAGRVLSLRADPEQKVAARAKRVVLPGEAPDPAPAKEKP